MSNDPEYIENLEAQLVEANRTIQKSKEALAAANNYFSHKSAINAAQHLSKNVLNSPLESNISSVLKGIHIYEKFWIDAAAK